MFAPHQFSVGAELGFLAASGLGEGVGIDHRHRRKRCAQRFQCPHAATHHQTQRLGHTGGKCGQLRHMPIEPFATARTGRELEG